MTGSYSQRELLLLSNYVYIPVSTSGGTIGQIIDRYRDANGGFSEESVLEAARGGGMTCSDVATVFSGLDARIKENPAFGRLSVSRSLEEYDVRALCFTDEKDKNPCVVFRGTGGTKEAWTDNFEGAFEEDTRLQKVAEDFIKNECAIYSDIVVTGHSKGGNLAQYVTVCDDRISRCVSFDGQGFGDDFIKKNKEAIEAASGKICSVSAYNDFVNILLTSIAGTTIYVENGSSAADAHSSVTLFTQNSFDANGDIVSTRSRGGVSAVLDHITDRICDLLSPLDREDKKTLGSIAGSAISLALTTPGDRLREDCLAPTLGMIVAAVLEKTARMGRMLLEDRPLYARSVRIDTALCRDAALRLKEQSDLMEKVAGSVNEIRQNMAYSITSKVCAENALLGVCYSISGIRSDVGALSELITDIADNYEKTEELVNLEVTKVSGDRAYDIASLPE